MSRAAASGHSLGAPRSMRLLSDDRLARRATQGDQRAFEAIYRRYHQDLYRFCLAMVSHPQDAQDALQNTMVKVLRALPGEERQIKLKPWLYRIARNEAVETLRRRRDNAELEPDEVRSSIELAQTAEDRDRLRVLLVDLKQLPDRQRAALVMRELAGLDFAQIGEAFGSSAGVARQTLYEARLSLRQMEEGREMRCEAVMQTLSDADGRVARRRGLHAHLRGCSSCRAFRDSIAKRRDELAAIAPLPVALSAGLLQALVGGQASVGGAASAASAAGTAGAGGAGGLTGTIGVGAGKAIATSAIVKSAATVAAVAVVGGAAADRGGVIDLPVPGGQGAATRDISEPAQPSTLDEGRGAVAREPGPPGDQLDKAGRRQGAAPGEGAANSRHAGKAKGRPVGAGGPHRSSTDGGARSHSGRGKSQVARERGGPSATTRGQETARTHKSPHANSSPGKNGESRAKPTPAQPPKSEGSPAAPPVPAPNPKAGGAASKSAGPGPREEPEP